MIPLIDTHCHLSSSAFDADRDAVIGRAEAAGVARIFCMGETYADNQQVLALARRYPMVLPALGHYPEHLNDAMAEATETLIREHHREIVAIGEVGLDRRLATTEVDRAHQTTLFDRFVRLALELDLPLSVHSRSAGHYVISRLQDLGARRVCLHAFDGKASYALPAARAGYFFSIPPTVLRSAQKQKLVRALPLERLLLESDAPVLGPEAGVRNEPANLVRAVERIAELKGVAPEAVRRACLENTRALFGPAGVPPGTDGEYKPASRR